ncbi:transcriptional regulator [Superficieibacter electus]|uniref:Transcriptional regulator n=1 Tax=Superficieibacter electus TaxID=2022662 RepID=A0A2P5GQX0_9ENTR|nr:biofilm development regulator YmgB/AriR family protein [Superficieibacter electus]POP43429.1 transcriptional regulator [Superficieibacter electus]POP48944.1 transcriptional regulator [Superficieibacter electus]
MRQTINNPALHAYFLDTGDMYAAEQRVLDSIIKKLIAGNITLSNKAIILCLIGELEQSSDVVQLDILRNCLEIVVGRKTEDEDYFCPRSASARQAH